MGRNAECQDPNIAGDSSTQKLNSENSCCLSSLKVSSEQETCFAVAVYFGGSSAGWVTACS